MSKKENPAKNETAISKVDTEAAALAEENGEAAEERQADAEQAAKVEAARAEVKATLDAKTAQAKEIAAERAELKAKDKELAAKQREIGRPPSCTSEAIRLACENLDCSTEEWTAAMAAAGYENGTLNKAAGAMLAQVRVITRHLRKYGHMPAKVENK